MSKKYVYLFREGNKDMRELLGGKGANLAEMTNAGMPVPKGFTVTTEACTQYYEDGRKINDDIQAEILKNLAILEEENGKRFGDPENPLLVSVRSGARASMPGMMDTILNLGINDTVAEGLVKLTNNPRFVYDSYRRFIQMFSDVVMELPKRNFEDIIDQVKEQKGVQLDSELETEDMQSLVSQFKAFYLERMGEEFPQDPKIQLMEAVRAVFRSWDNPRAQVYRAMNDIPADWGTAVNVQTMVFGNWGDDSGTGVAFTRNPTTGEKELYGDFLMNAQGEDVVAGIRRTSDISELKKVNPAVYEQFVDIATRLENHYRDMQDMEFTIERGQLYMLQTRNGKRTPGAALKIAVDLVKEGMISEQEALLMLEPNSLDAVLHDNFTKEALASATPIATGVPASPGAGCGAVYFTAEDCEAHSAEMPVLLVRQETSTEDIVGMQVSQGILTARGGRASHAAVVARGMGRSCVAGVASLIVDEEAKVATLAGQEIHEGDFISIDGSTGNVYLGKLATEEATISGDFATIMEWADKYRQMDVRANADNPHDAGVALNFGAQGVGLTRTEHMFFAEDRIPAVREMIVATTVEQRKKALAKILPMQRGDFEGIFKAMKGLPVTIRLLDPPLHEFLPQEDEDIAALAQEMGMTFTDLKNVVISLQEVNPMMGLRGCRLPIQYPEIAEMQTQAIIEAALNVYKETGMKVIPEIMVPLVASKSELTYVKGLIAGVADPLIAAAGVDLPYEVGTMIELPRAALAADRIAEEAEFFCFGTNDLTQMTWGFSRDDSGKFLGTYLDRKIIEHDPFQRLDRRGVGRLMKIAVDYGRQVRPNMHIGICGEHGGDPVSIEFCHDIGLSYVSCSPFRVPIARLAAAQAAIKNPRK
ncbi:MAG: pyruvate, phosphate dikinase [Clostridiales bacterium]|nr:pyruvate, phosphate dikinase [Clostridiales bacterium]